jgi:hypothetical protein
VQKIEENEEFKYRFLIQLLQFNEEWKGVLGKKEEVSREILSAADYRIR